MNTSEKPPVEQPGQPSIEDTIAELESERQEQLRKIGQQYDLLAEDRALLAQREAYWGDIVRQAREQIGELGRRFAAEDEPRLASFQAKMQHLQRWAAAHQQHEARGRPAPRGRLVTQVPGWTWYQPGRRTWRDVAYETQQRIQQEHALSPEQIIERQEQYTAAGEELEGLRQKMAAMAGTQHKIAVAERQLARDEKLINADMEAKLRQLAGESKEAARAVADATKQRVALEREVAKEAQREQDLAELENIRNAIAYHEHPDYPPSPEYMRELELREANLSKKLGLPSVWSRRAEKKARQEQLIVADQLLQAKHQLEARDKVVVQLNSALERAKEQSEHEARNILHEVVRVLVKVDPKHPRAAQTLGLITAEDATRLGTLPPEQARAELKEVLQVAREEIRRERERVSVFGAMHRIPLPKAEAPQAEDPRMQEFEELLAPLE